jgi:site-specific recombinase XerD
VGADLGAGIRRVRGVRKIGVRLGNWLTAEEGKALWQAPDAERIKGKRDRALLALLLACGLRRHEAVGLKLRDLERREGCWAIVDLVGKGGHIRAVPIPDWVREQLESWIMAAGIEEGRIFRRVDRFGRTRGDRISVKAVWHIVKEGYGSRKREASARCFTSTQI